MTVGATHGRFWVDSEERSSSGELVVSPGRGYELRVDHQICPVETVTSSERPTEITISYNADEAVHVRDYRPRVVSGLLDDGTPLTLLDAHMSVPGDWIPGSSQVFAGYRSIVGAHVAGPDVQARAVRVNLNAAPAWAGHQEIPTSSGLIRTVPASVTGVEFIPNEPLPTDALVHGMRDVLINLMTLWTSGQKIQALRTELNLETDARCTYGFASEGTSVYLGSDLLPQQHLTLGRVAQWVDLAPTLGPLPFIATSESDILQRDAHTFAAALEGLHRRLHDDKRMIADASSSAIDKASRKAAQAATDHLTSLNSELNRDAVYKRYRTTLGHVAEPTYAERLRDLIDTHSGIAPGLLGPDPEQWVTDMTRIRNQESHQGWGTNQFGELEISEYFVYATSARWFLRLCLLNNLVGSAILTDALRDSSPFCFALANIDSEPTWGSYSALDAFRKASRQR